MTAFDIDELKRAYDLLGVPYSASASSIDDSYRHMTERWCPDRYDTGTEDHAEAAEMTERIHAAYAQIADAPLQGYDGGAPGSSDQTTRRARALASLLVADPTAAVHQAIPPWYTAFFGVRGLLRLFAVWVCLYSTVFFFWGALRSSHSEIRCVVDALGFVFEYRVVILLFSVISALPVWSKAISGTRENGSWAVAEELRSYDWWGRPIHHPHHGRKYTAYSLEEVVILLFVLLVILAVLLPALTK